MLRDMETFTLTHTDHASSKDRALNVLTACCARTAPHKPLTAYEKNTTKTNVKLNKPNLKYLNDCTNNHKKLLHKFVDTILTTVMAIIIYLYNTAKVQ